MKSKTVERATIGLGTNNGTEITYTEEIVMHTVLFIASPPPGDSSSSSSSWITRLLFKPHATYIIPYNQIQFEHLRHGLKGQFPSLDTASAAVQS